MVRNSARRRGSRSGVEVDKRRITRQNRFVSGREIKLDGGEIAIIKTLGLSGAPMFGKLLVSRIGSMEKGEFLDTLTGLIDQGYVLSNKVNVRLMADVERAFFRVNPAYGRELKETLRPGARRPQERRDRRSRR